MKHEELHFLNTLKKPREVESVLNLSRRDLTVDNTSYLVTIDLNSSTLEGDSTNPSLSAQWDKLSIVWDGYSWIRTSW